MKRAYSRGVSAWQKFSTPVSFPPAGVKREADDVPDEMQASKYYRVEGDDL